MSGLSDAKQAPPPLGGFDVEKEPAAPAYKEPLSKEGGWDRPQLVRMDVIPLALAGRSLQRGWLTAFGAAGLAVTIGEVAFKWGVWWFWFVVPSAIAFLIGHGLMKKRFVRLAGLFNFEADKSGRVYLTTMGGSCPVCNAEIKLKDIGPQKRSKTVIQCADNRTHQWAFDPKQLESL